MKAFDVKKTVLSILFILIGVAIALLPPPDLLTVASMRFLGCSWPWC